MYYFFPISPFSESVAEIKLSYVIPNILDEVLINPPREYIHCV